MSVHAPFLPARIDCTRLPGIDARANFAGNLEVIGARFPQVRQLLTAAPERYDLMFAPAEQGGWVLQARVGTEWRALSAARDPLGAAQTVAQSRVAGPPHFTPALLFGLSAGYEFAAICRRLNRQPGGRWQAFYALEPVPELLRAALLLHDWRDELAAENVFLFAGPAAAIDFQRFLAADDWKPLPSDVIVFGDQAGAKTAAAVVSETIKSRAQRAQELKTRVDAHYDDAWLAGLEPRERWRGGLRFLLIDSGFSHFVRYANRDIAEALERLGHRTLTIGERERPDELTGLVLLAAIEAFKPDVIHQVDHLRLHKAHVAPRNLPFVTTMLDHFPAYERPETAAKLGDLDFVAGYVGHWTRYGCSAAHLLPQEPMTNERVFRPVALTDAQRRRYAAEAAYLSNISKTPEETMAELRQRLRGVYPDAVAVADEAAGRIAAHYAAGRALYAQADYENLLRELPRAVALPGAVFQHLAYELFNSVGAAYFRLTPLLALSAAGVDLALWGRGWERHPQLAKHARGVAAHGEETNLVFNATALNLHINHFAVRHNRLVDGYAAGGFFLVHRQQDEFFFDLRDVLFAGGAEAVELARRFLNDPAAREAHAARNRAIALERLTYVRQYETALRRMSATVAAGRAERRLRATVQAAVAARPAAAPPVREALRDRPLLAALRELTGVDFATEGAQPFGDGGAAPLEAGAWLAARLAEAVELLASRGGDSWARPVKVRTCTSLHAVRLPFGCCAAPDDRVGVNEWDGVRATHDRKVFVVDPTDGRVAEFARGPGLQPGAFGPDGAYYAQLYGERGIFRLTARERRRLLSTPGDDVYLHTVALAGGELLLHDWTNTALRLHGPDGAHLAELLPPGRFGGLRALTAQGDDFWFVADGAIYAGNVGRPGEIRLCASPPFGVFDHVTATPNGLVASLAYLAVTGDGTERRIPWGLCGIERDGAVAFLSPRIPFVATPIFLCAAPVAGENRLAALDVRGRCLLTLAW